MLAPNPISSYNRRPSFVNPKYFKKAQSEKPCLYKLPYYKDDLANIFAQNHKETLTLEEESISKLDKEKIKKWQQSITQEITVLVKNLLIPLVIKTKANANEFERSLKQEMFEDIEYVQSLEKEVDELEYEKDEFLNEYDVLLQECVSKDIMCSILRSLADIDEQTELQYLPQNGKQAVRDMNVIKPGMYRLNTWPTQTREPQLPKTYRNTNPRVSTSTRVIHRISVSRPQLRSTPLKENVVQNNSQVKIKKKEVEDHHRISSFSNKTKFVTVCNDSLKSKTSIVNDVCATCGKCMFNSNHDAYVSKFINDVNARTKKPKAVLISTRKPKRKTNHSVSTYNKGTVASESTIQKSRSYFRMLYEKTSKTWTWWIEKQCPSGYKWRPKTKMKWVHNVRTENVSTSISPTIDTESRRTNDSPPTYELGSNLSNAPPDLVQGNIMIKRVYYVECLNHNLFLVGQFCDADLKVAFWKFTCFVRDLQGKDLLMGVTNSSVVMGRRLFHLNFNTINLLSRKDIVNGLPKLKYVKDQLISSCEIEFKVQDHNNEPLSSKMVPNGVLIANMTDPSLQELELLSSPMYEEYFTTGNKSVSKSCALSDNLQQQDTQPTLNVQPTLELTTPTNVNTEETNTYQAADAPFEAYEFFNPFCTSVQDVHESSSRNIDTSNMHTFYQRHCFDYHWTKDHPCHNTLKQKHEA
ncbi:hypothetical protein Tco_0534921 [Tanacetum coccineum]